MVKRFMCISLVIIMAFSFTSCIARVGQEGYEYKTLNAVSCISDGVFEYNGIEYVEFDNRGVFAPYTDVENAEADGIMLGWDAWTIGRGVLGYVSRFYSYSEMNPVFIYETRTRTVYLQKSYDYMSDEFMIDGASVKIDFSNIMNAEKIDVVFKNIGVQSEIVMYSEKYPDLKIRLCLGTMANGMQNQLKVQTDMHISSHKSLRICFWKMELFPRHKNVINEWKIFYLSFPRKIAGE